MTLAAFSIAGSLLSLYGLLMFALFLVAMARAVVSTRRTKSSAAVVPEIRESLIDHMAGSDDLTRIKQLMRTNRRDVASTIFSFQGTVGGSALDRLCNLALNLGLVQDWIQEGHSRDPVRRRLAFSRLAFVSVYEPCRRMAGDMLIHALKDDDPEVWLCACRATIESGSGEQIESVFDIAVSHSLLMRILLTEALRRHAAPLCEHAVPETLRSNDPKRVLAVLDILVAWERAIAIDNLHDLLDHRSKDIRIQALRLAPLVPLVPDSRAAIVRALADGDPEISTAAALSAGRLQIVEALPLLARMLRLAPAELARTAAAALAEMPPRGWQALEELSANSNPVTAAAAAGALGRAKRKAGV
ncbi:MAG TPA: HEAT repeat domain-containing protein [Bryobacteraceae bacterium]|nr:HEAT repeat domain-containing protein [Bryobacteraceae bacterium]